MDNENIMSLDELRAYLPDRPSRRTVYNWTSAGAIPHFKLGKKLFFEKSQVDIFNEERKNK
jgi:excisionase family DNA binding protein